MTQQIDFGEVPPLTLGWRIQMAIDHAGLKQTDLMERFEVSRQTVSRWCNDVGTPPKRFILEVIAAMCQVSAAWLTDGIGQGPQPPDGPTAITADVQIPARARLVVVDGEGQIDEEVTRHLVPVTDLSGPVILRLTAGCAANCATGDDSATLPHELLAAA